MACLIPLATAQQAADNDARITQETGITAYTLMCRAAQAGFDALTQRWSNAYKVYIVAGPGNNGGDGYALGKLLLEAGYAVEVFAIPAIPQKAPATQAHQAYVAAGGAVYLPAEFSTIHTDSSQLAVVVDALFGSGLSRAPQGLALEAIQWMNSLTVPKIALDIPSGLSADTGAILSQATQAQLTVTFIIRKTGLYTGAGQQCCGEVVYSDLQLPPAYTRLEADEAVGLMNEAEFEPLVAVRADAHKGSFGHALVVGGDHGMGGAVRLAAEAAMRCGAGLVSVVTRRLHVAPVLSACPVVMVHAVEQAAEATAVLSTLCARANVVAIGPGLGDALWGMDLFACAIEQPLYKVVDASALHLLAHEPQHRQDWILTPHPGEAARLLATDTPAVQADRIGAGREIVSQYGGVCILKGSGTIVCSEQGLAICPRGSASLATAGSGDVLSGIVVGLLAQVIAQNDSFSWASGNPAGSRAAGSKEDQARCSHQAAPRQAVARQAAPENAIAALHEVSVRAVYLHAWLGEEIAPGRIRSILASDLLSKLSVYLNKLNFYQQQ